MMKNILTNLMLVALTLCFSIGTYAQSVEKYIDLEILQLKYASNEVIPYGEEYLIEVAMINHGPDELLQGDFVLILESISPFSLYYPHGLAVGDTATISVISFINSRELDEVYEACVWIQFDEELHENNFTLIDSNQMNDTVCFSVVLQGENSINIDEFTEENHFTVYPNPIKGHQSLFIKHNEAQGAMPRYVRVINILGQEVYQSTLSTDKTIDLPTLATGIYYLELRDDESMLLHHQSVQIE